MPMQCSLLGVGEIPPLVDGYRECLTDATRVMLRIYEIGLSNGDVTPEDNSNAISIFNDTNGIVVDVTKPFTIDVSGLNIPDGTYTHTYFRYHNTRLFDVEYKFPSAQFTPGSNASGSGAYCFSKGVDATEEPSGNNSQVTCHASEFSTASNTVTFNFLGDPIYPDGQLNQGIINASKLYILDSDLTQSTGDVTYNDQSGEPTLGSNDRTFILQSTELQHSLHVDDNTDFISVSLPGSETVALGFNSNNEIFQTSYVGFPVDPELSEVKSINTLKLLATVDLSTDTQTEYAVQDIDAGVPFKIRVLVPTGPRFFTNYEGVDPDVEIISFSHDPKGIVDITMVSEAGNFDVSYIRMGFPGEGGSYDTTPTKLLTLVTY